jgi:hypothetical protein
VDAILYVVEGGIKWRMLPKDFPLTGVGFRKTGGETRG